MVKCPNCGKDVEVSLALQHQIEEDLRIEFREELDKARKAELEIRKEKNLVEEEKKNLELITQRRIDEERKKIIEKTTEQIMEQQRLKEKDKDKVIEDLKKSLEEAQRKATRGSQQSQGEVQELDLENILRGEFSGDSIEAIGKGVLGADVRQRVKSPRGVDCGVILWESKRTKTWSEGWIGKLKEDLRADGAHLPVIVSETMPDDVKHGLGFRDGVWIVSPIPDLIVTLAASLRRILLYTTRQKMVSESKATKAEEIYEFITSHEFSQQVESMLETYTAMKGQIDHERTVYEKLWKQRETQVQKLLTGVSGVYGSIQGIAGSALPAIKSLQLEAGS